MIKNTSLNLTCAALLLIPFAFSGCGGTTENAVSVVPPESVDPAIQAVLSDSPPAASISVIEARNSAKPGDSVTVEGVIAGVMSPFAEGFASVVIGDLSIQTCDKIPGDDCPTPWDACCADPDDLKGARLTIQILDDEGRPVGQGLKGVSGLKEMDGVVVEGTVTADSTAENLVLNAKSLYRKG